MPPTKPQKKKRAPGEGQEHTAVEALVETALAIPRADESATTGSPSPPDTELSASTAESLGEPAETATPNDVAPATADATPDQKLHGATFGGDPEPDVAQEESPTNTGRIGDILDQLDPGFSADDTTNFEKLIIARKYGALLLELKELVPHGKFQETLRERFPKINYAKCNRWMYIASHEAEVAEALEKYRDVAWGPKKLIDFLNESWHPEKDDEEDEDDDCCGWTENGPLEEAEPNIIVVRRQEEIEPHAVPRGATAGPVVPAVPTLSGNPSSRPSRKKKRSASRPAAPAAARKATTFGDRLSEILKNLDDLSEMQLPIGDDLGHCLSDAEAIGARVVALLTKLHEANTADRADLTV